MTRALFIALLVTSPFLSLPSQASDPAGYLKIPSTQERAKPGSGFVEFPNFPKFQLVTEDNGTPDPNLTSLVEDSIIKSRIRNGYFSSLQVRDLYIKTSEIFSEGKTTHYPFAISVKHSQGDNNWKNPNQGTVELAGELLVHFDGSDLSVEVVNFYDSQWVERQGRKIGFNQDVDLEFGKGVVKPLLEHFFSNNPKAMQILINMATTPTVPPSQSAETQIVPPITP